MYMATLSTRERKELPTEIFGLPDERKYPLTDEAHVRKAIQFFKFCPPGKRNLLSKNINARAKELGMTLKLTKDSSYYRYADKTILQESAYDVYEFQRLVEVGQNEITEATNLIDSELKSTIQGFINKLVDPDPDKFLAVEEQLQRILFRSDSMQRTYGLMGKEHCINPIRHVNIAMKKAYDLMFSYICYANSEQDMSEHKLIESVLEDCFRYIQIVINTTTCRETVVKQINTISEIMAHFKCNNFYVIRKLKELDVDCEIMLRNNITPGNGHENPELHSKVLSVKKVINDFIGDAHEYSRSIVSNRAQNSSKMFDILWGSNLNLVHSKDYLKVLKNELKSQIDIILLTNDIKLSYSNDFDTIRFITHDVVDVNHRVILDILTFLEGSIKKENIKLYNKKYSLNLDSKDLLIFSELKKFDRMYVGKDNKGGNVYYGICKSKLYLLGKTNIPGQVVFIKLYDGCECLSTMNLIVSNVEEFDRTDKLKAIKININQEETYQSLTEGITFDEHGGFQFSFKPKKTYMDEYAENHKLIIQNHKAKNYEALKTNLAFLFALINNIERKVLYNSKKGIKPNVKEDALKARAFAINDFKTYLKEVQRNEPTFNFTKYYEESDYGKVTIGFKKEELVGLKRLFQTIVLS